jgi:hypothetical protein
MLANQALVDGLTALADLRTLRLNTAAADLDLSPLLQLSRLSRLHTFDRVSLAQCAVIKRLAALTALESGRGYCDCAVLLQLLRPPHSLQRLQAIEFRFETVDPPLLEGLLSLPALTELWADLVQPDCWAGLGGLTRLQRLRVGWCQIFSSAQRSALESSLHSLPRLSDLELTLSADARVGGQPIDLRLAALSSLRAESVLLPSLGFLQLSPRLDSLRLIQCGMPSADEVLRSLRSFAPQLRRLELDRCVRLTDEQHSALRPLSVLLPALSEFAYERP